MRHKRFDILWEEEGLERASNGRSISFHYHRFFHAPYQSLSEEANKTFNFFQV